QSSEHDTAGHRKQCEQQGELHSLPEHRQIVRDDREIKVTHLSGARLPEATDAPPRGAANAVSVGVVSSQLPFAAMVPGIRKRRSIARISAITMNVIAL